MNTPQSEWTFGTLTWVNTEFVQAIVWIADGVPETEPPEDPPPIPRGPGPPVAGGRLNVFISDNLTQRETLSCSWIR